MTALSGRVLLTGASGGLGHAIARTLAPLASELVLTSRRSEMLEALAAELGARVIVCDLAVRDEVERLIGEVEPLDVLIANAGVSASGRLDELSQDEVDRMLEINLRAPIALARAFAPGMAARGHGHIVFMSSLQGKAATPAAPIYVATKFGLRGFALGLRQDLRLHGVGVSVVLPGFIRDAGLFADSGAKLPPGIGTRSPQDVADAVRAAIEGNRAEIDVAPVGLRLGTAVASLAPAFAAAVSRRLGSEKIAAEIVAGQRAKR
ncbi:MAG: SDR family NAD(P)-dependent oxidoreductase [Solirubrobacterales bacterium]|nr:SDR family NAD(P)-dependent oxidoreductase [Solirubrobacterales bacterium]